jgi:hypothetical protein
MMEGRFLHVWRPGNGKDENRAKLAALRTAIEEGVVGGSKDSDVVFAKVGEVMDKLVAYITPEDRYPEVSLGAKIGREIIE